LANGKRILLWIRSGENAVTATGLRSHFGGKHRHPIKLMKYIAGGNKRNEAGAAETTQSEAEVRETTTLP